MIVSRGVNIASLISTIEIDDIIPPNQSARHSLPKLPDPHRFLVIIATRYVMIPVFRNRA